MKSLASSCVFILALSTLSAQYIVHGLTLRRSSSASDVDALRKAVNNAFDALSKVHDAIGNLQEDARHSSLNNNNNFKNNGIHIQAMDSSNTEKKRSSEEEKSSEMATEKTERRSKAEKKTVTSSTAADRALKRSQDEKFIEEVRELENVMARRKKKEDIHTTKKDEEKNEKEAIAKKQETKRERGNSDAFTEGPQKLISLFGKGKRASSDTVAMVTDDLSDEDIKQSVDFIVGVLKDGLQTEAKDSKLKDLLTTILEKEDTTVSGAKQHRTKDQSSASKAGQKKLIKDQSSSAATEQEEFKRKSSSSTADKDLKTKKELHAAEKLKNSAELDVASKSLDDGRSSTAKSESTTAQKKETKTSDVTVTSDTTAVAASSKKDESAIFRSDRELSKRNRVETALREASSSSRRFEDEVQELVNMILKRKEAMKREKLKMALADMFREMESKVTDEADSTSESAHAYSRRSAGKADSELRKFAEDMLLLNGKVV